VAFDGDIGVFRACGLVAAASGEGAGEVGEGMQEGGKEPLVDQKAEAKGGMIRGIALGI
jgi:hypothetical protein